MIVAAAAFLGAAALGGVLTMPGGGAAGTAGLDGRASISVPADRFETFDDISFNENARAEVESIPDVDIYEMLFEVV